MFKHNGTARNYRIVGLTPHNTVVTQQEGKPPEDSGEKPSEWAIRGKFVTWIDRMERGLLRYGLTPSGYDRAAPLASGVIWEEESLG